MLIFFLLLPLFGIAYVCWHLWCLIPLSGLFRMLLITCLTASFGLLFLNISRFIDGLPMWLARLSYDIGSSSIFILLYLVIIFLVLDLGRLCGIVPKQILYHNFYTSTVLLISLFVIFLWGNIQYHHKQRVELSLTTEKALPKPMKLILISDLHLGYHNPRKELHRWIDLFNAENPDLVLIAGDIIDMSIRPLDEEQMHEEFKRLKAPVYACLGNHEYYSSEPAAQRFYREAGIRLLQDSMTSLGSLTIIGRDDRTNMYRKQLKDILAVGQTFIGRHYTILLDHQPYHLEEAEQNGIDFQFSGHTHYGQVWPISWITRSVYECAYGEHQRGNTQYYISSGIGIWGGKYRIGTQSEYVVLNLTEK
jgi:hypothetical protein